MILEGGNLCTSIGSRQQYVSQKKTEAVIRMQQTLRKTTARPASSPERLCKELDVGTMSLSKRLFARRNLVELNQIHPAARLSGLCTRVRGI